MITRQRHLLAVVLAVLAIGLNTAYGREPSLLFQDSLEPVRVIEEVTVNGTDAAAEYRTRQARFEAEMAAFARTVQARYRVVVRSRLARSIHGADCDNPGIRG